ncbi:TonB-dependent receptor [Hyphomicrobium sp. 2TAF46]|uniref:TonB-dependent receptor n=1 Tax=Hyphomicrobium sp. 2TAF46 TaxID=3233019 RepID=UPI003F915CE1
MRRLTVALMLTTASAVIGSVQAQEAAQPAQPENKATTTAQPEASAPSAAPASTYSPVATPPAAPQSSAAAPKSAPQNNGQASSFGTIVVPEAQQPLSQTGMTASPTDYAAVKDKAAAARRTTGTNAGTAGAGQTSGDGSDRPVSLGGVTGQDFGGGNMIMEQAKKSRSTVTRDSIDKQAPTANPYQLINLLPGVVASSTDNAGLNGGNIRIRGFNSDHIGLTIEGMPVNDSGNYALYPQEYVDAENIGQISLSQGSPELDSPHVGATGGVINIYAIDPSKTMGALVDYSIGSNGLSREFVRINSGQVGAFRAFLSYSRLDQDHWGNNPGDDTRDHIDFKMAVDLSPGNTIRFSAIYNNAVNNNYPNPTLKQFNNNENFAFLSTLPSSFFNTTSPIDQSANNASNYYKYKVNPFQNLIVSAPSNFTLSDKLKFDTIPYLWHGYGNGGGVTTMSDTGMFWGNMKITNVNYGGTAALTDKTLYYNPSITETNRPGVINKFTYTEGNHQFVFGNWFEYAMHNQWGGFSPLNADGSVASVWGDKNNFVLPSTAVCQKFNTATNKYDTTVTCPAGAMQKRDVSTTTMTNMLFVGDSWKFAPNWTADVGVKQVFVNRTVEDGMPFAPRATNDLYDAATLPTLGLKYRWDRENQLFASINTSFRSAQNFTLTPNYSSTSQASGAPPVKIPDPERGIVYELGHRYQGQMLATSITGFLGRYENFQQSTNILDPNTGTNYSSTINVGGLMNYGVDFEAGTRPINNFRPYIGMELLRTEQLDNMQTVNTAGKLDYLPTKGKQLVGAPQFTTGIGLDYDNGHLFANLNYKYIGSQYSTFMNDEKIDAYGRLDASIGYRFDDIAQLKQPEIKLSLFNLLNSSDLTGVNSFQTNASQTTGVNGGTIKAASAPTYYLGQDFSFMVTLRAGL